MSVLLPYETILLSEKCIFSRLHSRCVLSNARSVPLPFVGSVLIWYGMAGKLIHLLPIFVQAGQAQ